VADAYIGQMCVQNFNRLSFIQDGTQPGCELTQRLVCDFPFVLMPVILTLGATAFVTIRVLEPTLRQIAETSPEFMDVPVPLILAVLGIGLAVRFLLFARLRLV